MVELQKGEDGEFIRCILRYTVVQQVSEQEVTLLSHTASSSNSSGFTSFGFSAAALLTRWHHEAVVLPCPKFSLVSHKNMTPPCKISSTCLLWRLRVFKAFREFYFIERKRAHSWRTIAFLDGAMTAWANLPISHAALKVSLNSINGEESHKMCQPVENLSLQINAVLPINTFSCT